MTALKRGALVLVVAGVLAGCLPARDVATPTVSASIVTPSPPTYRYSWVMVHDWQSWGVQIGPKVDGSGIHVAVYGWQNCAGPCGWEFFREYQPLDAGSVHVYAITRTAAGWALSCDGVVLQVLDPGSANPITEVGSEVTTS